MNLHAIVSPIISAINPMIAASVKYSSGYTTSPDGSQVPQYTIISGVPVQVQALTAKEIAHLDSLNIQGVMRAIYLNGNSQGVDRALGQGGDLFVFASDTSVPVSIRSTSWLVTTVLETWETGWCKVAVTQQLS